MKKYFWLISSFAVFGFGMVLHYAYELSDASAWSILVSSVNLSAWELYKPFALIYISWIVIELSYLRPSLLHYVCAKILSLHLFTLSMLLGSTLYLMLTGSKGFSDLYFLGAFGLVVLSEWISWKMYLSEIKWEIFWIPILLSLFVICFMLLIFSLYPPHNAVFYDFLGNDYGPYNYNFAENNLRF